MKQKLYILLFFVSNTIINVYGQERQMYTPEEERKTDYFFYEGLKLKNAEKFDSSYEMFKRCLEIDSTSSAALYELASYCLNMDKADEAVTLLKKAIKYAPDNEDYHSTLASLFFNLGMFGEAAEEYDYLVKSMPGRPELNYFLAESYSRMGEIGMAIDTYNALENVMGMHEALSMAKYHLYMTLEKPEKAFDEMKRLIDKFPVETRYMIMLGDLYLQQDDTVKALQYYKKAHEIDPESPYYHVSMANYYEKTGNGEAAEKQIDGALLNKQLDVNTKLSILARYIMQLQRSKQNIDVANILFQMLLDQHPEDSRLKLAFGDFLSSQGKNNEAQFQYQLITESEPDNLIAWQQLLALHFRQNNYEEAIKICTKCINIFPDESLFKLYLGISYYQKHEYQNAINTYQSAISAILPEENKALISDFYGQIGDTYFKINKTDSAFVNYEKALIYNDKNIVVLNNYAYYLSLLKKDLTKAERMSALCIKIEPENATYIDTYAWIFFVQGNYLLAKIYIEQSIAKDRTNNPEIIDHYGDILYMSNEKEKALEQWKKAKELGKKSATLDRKIAEQQYFEEKEEERINNTDSTNE
ncbi:MAG: tetratricopeptide repeat protein [Tannerella sp.]|jgi:tetratricopeptide (TPR) repeat protein|nr:tetratricopeptide repeat protein [Tannerella sp.]